MRQKLLAITLTATLASLAVAQDSIGTQRYIGDLSKAATSMFYRYNTDVLGTYAEYGRPVAKLQFNDFRSTFGQELATAQNWSEHNLVCLKMKNLENRTLEFRFIVLLTDDPKDFTNAFTGSFKIEAGRTRRFVFHLNVDDPHPYGLEYMNPVLRLSHTNIRQGSTVRDLRNIRYWRISYQGTGSARVDITDLRLMNQVKDFQLIADKYGQYTRRTWNGKFDSDDDFVRAKIEEMNDLAANPGPGEMDGTTKIPNLDPLYGRWRIRTSPNGMRYFQHPSGKLFWSLGVSGVHEGASTPVAGRESYFRYLPSRSGWFAQCWEQMPTRWGQLDCYSFSKQNLIYKYGAYYEQPWEDTVRKRITSWGINTLGIQCNPVFLDGSIPHVVQLDTDDFPTRLTVPVMLWESLPDPFDWRFVDWMKPVFADRLLRYADDINFMGVFVDNEISWGDQKSEARNYNVPLGAITAPSTQPAKLAFIDQLKAKYGTISTLNTAWATRWSSWDSLKFNRTWKPVSYTTSMVADFRAFIKAYAAKYYGSVREALDSIGFKRLYLGSRFCDYNPDVIEGAAPSVDVLSFNYYRTVDKVDWDWLDRLPKPVLISEIGYGTQDRGTFGGPCEVPSHNDRVARMKEFFNEALSRKNIVGVHWYCYKDQPITGRWSDFENSGMGIVDVTDTPYGPTVDFFRQFSKDMYVRRG